jgi:hypothetical protein
VRFHVGIYILSLNICDYVFILPYIIDMYVTDVSMDDYFGRSSQVSARYDNAQSTLYNNHVLMLYAMLCIVELLT